MVEATPAGMAGVAEVGPQVDGGSLRPGQVAVDLVYHPPITPWLAAAAAAGATTLGGLGMLVHQAAAQLAAWTGHGASGGGDVGRRPPGHRGPIRLTGAGRLAG